MAKDSKKRKAERKEKRIAWQLAQVEESKKLPSTVALPVYLHSLNYQLNFGQYKHKECELPLLESKTAEALITKLDLITQHNSRNIASTKLIRDNISPSGPYKSLFNGLGKDVELKEIQFSGTGRIFCHLVNDHPDSDGKIGNYCCVVAIKLAHIPLD